MARKLDLADLYNRPGFMIRRCHQLALSVFATECEDLNLTTSQFGAMYVLMCHPEIDQITLAGLLGIDRSTTSLVVSGLEKRSILTRKACAKDKRKRLLSLTKEGVALLRRAMPCAQSAQARLIGALSEKESAQFLRLLAKLLDAFQSEMRVPLRHKSM